jgi:hypothetical protein
MALADGNRRRPSGEQLTINNNIVSPDAILPAGNGKSLGVADLTRELGNNLTSSDHRLFSRWDEVNDVYGSKRQWEIAGRAVNDGANPSAHVVLGPTHQAPLWALDQTHKVAQQPRTRAYLEFEQLFFDLCNKKRYLRFDSEHDSWRQQVIGDGEPFFRRLTSQKIRQHINGSAIHGVCAGTFTRFIALDLDFHGRDRDIFLEQARVLLEEISGKDAWHYQVARDNIDGIHAFKVFKHPILTSKAIGDLRHQILDLDDKHPDLAMEANKAGMTSLGQVEIYPDFKRGFRLPLCWGREMLLDRPLDLVTHQKKTVQDVEGYIRWLQDLYRKYMPAEQVLRRVSDELAPTATKKASKTVASQSSVAEPSIDDVMDDLGGGLVLGKPVSETGDIQILSDEPLDPSGKLLGHSKGRFRQQLIELYGGKRVVRGSLNRILVLGAGALWLEEIDQKTAIQILRNYISELPDKSVSSRLENGDWEEVERTIRSTVKQFYKNHNQPSTDVHWDSRETLLQTAAAWRLSRFKFSDLTTWNQRQDPFGAGPSIAWTAQEQTEVKNVLCPVLNIKTPEMAIGVVDAIIKLVAAKEKAEDGISYKYWQSFLRDRFELRMGNRNKVHSFLDALGPKGLDLIAVHAKSQFFGNGRKGVATRYSVAPWIRERLDLTVGISDEADSKRLVVSAE